VALGGMTVGELVAILDVDDSKFDSKLGGAERRFGKLGGVLKTAGVAAGTAALAGLGAILHTGTQEAMDASAAQAQLEAGIKSTGGAAGVTVGHLNDLASEIQAYSGQTDDSIAQTEALLLTFTNIKNAGPDKIFDQATRAAADMAARMGTEAPAAAIQLGKALNDPVKGVTALTRVGVQFTDGQKAQIAAMMEAGDVAGAQKIILAELSKEFGGAAKAAGESLPGQVDKAKRAFEDMSQSIVAGVLPTIVGVLPHITGALADVASGVKRIVGDIVAGFKSGGLRGALDAVVDMIKRTAPKVGRQLLELGKEFLAWIGPLIPPLIERLGKLAQEFVAWIAPLIPPILVALGKIAAKIVWWIVSKLLPALVKALAGIALQLVKSSLSLMAKVGAAIVRGLWNGVKAAWGAFVGYLASLPRRIASAFGGDLGRLLYSAGAKVVTGMWNGIKSMAGWLYGKVRGFASGIFDAVKKGLGKLWPGSPSRAGIELGYFFGLGIEKGVLASLPRAAAAVGKLGGAFALSEGSSFVVAPKLAFAGTPTGAASTAPSIVVHPGAVNAPISITVGHRARAADVGRAARRGVEQALVGLAREISALGRR